MSNMLVVAVAQPPAQTEMPQVGLQADRARMRESHRQQIYSEQEGPEVRAAAVAAVAVELK